MTSLLDSLAAEWLKLRTLRSTYVILAVVACFVGGMALLAWYAVTIFDGLPPAGRATFGLASLPRLLVEVAALSLAVLGVLTITTEYATGLIRTTFTATPRRAHVLTAKAAVVAVVAFGAGLAAVAATAGLERLILGDRAIRGTETIGPALLLAFGASVTVFALLGLGLGAITRSATASITVLVLTWYVLPMVAHNLPAPWGARIGSVLPGALAGQLAGVGNANSVYGALLSPWGAAATMATYALGPLIIAGVLLHRRDAR